MIRLTHLAAIALCGTVAFAAQAPQTSSQTPPAGSSTDATQSSTQTQTEKKTTKTRTRTSEASTPSSGESMVGEMDRNFLMKAAEGGMMEVQLAQLAQKQAANDQVKQYAQKLEQDHSAANKQLMDIAQRRGVNVPSTLKPEDQQTIDRLSKLSGAEFDREYIRHMVKDHRKDVKEFDKESQKAMDTDVKTFAANTLPTLKDHLSKAEEIDRTTNTGGSRSRTKEHKEKSKTMKDDTTPATTPPSQTATPPETTTPQTTTPPPQTTTPPPQR